MLLQKIARYCDSLLDVSLLLMWRRFEPPSRPFSSAVSSRIGLGKLSTLPSVSNLGREEGGDCGGKKKKKKEEMSGLQNLALMYMDLKFQHTL